MLAFYAALTIIVTTCRAQTLIRSEKRTILPGGIEPMTTASLAKQFNRLVTTPFQIHRTPLDIHYSYLGAELELFSFEQENNLAEACPPPRCALPCGLSVCAEHVILSSLHRNTLHSTRPTPWAARSESPRRNNGTSRTPNATDHTIPLQRGMPRASGSKGKIQRRHRG